MKRKIREQDTPNDDTIKYKTPNRVIGQYRKAFNFLNLG
jgi:hypothetical protein